MRRILVVSPHPDDAEIGCGASIHEWLSQGHEVTIGVCTGPGELTMLHSGACVSFQQRRDEQEAAAVALGGAQVKWLMLARASRFDECPQVNFVASFDQLFPQYDMVVLPMPSYNDDHRRVWEAGIAACRPGRIDGVGVYAYEQANANCLGEQLPGREFGKIYQSVKPEAVEAKKKAILCHQSQMNGRTNSIYGPEAAEALARLRGLEVGLDYAEMFYLIRAINFTFGSEKEMTE